ncbi:GlxA family transcriptional regulator [Actinopolymorpha pittospori]|uniref:Transcriptional regulator GlxA family with amidase domain n=1 Tax=Actinopolymorpha pittospori TaxID=648752 RepID=A0A927RAQ7_9ACTN|nr:helix-turn-helix domain-containing protein [Actinopolymorpha pittospori]MBE1607909.1 transcriptional regulator GlxA family with amidase domain [Actinopolymorpha pittospori]
MAAAGWSDDQRHRIAVLALDGVVAFDLGAATQIFQSARDDAERRHYVVRVATPGGEPVRASAGFTVQPDHGLEILTEAHTVLVPGTHTGSPLFDGALDPEVGEALRQVLAAGRRLMSTCTGAFVLAAAGVLDGRPATTHWAHADRFRELYPKVRLDPEVLFVDDGDVLTSAGVAAGIDLCLHVVRRDHGAEVANRVARRCVVPPWRDGGQSQYIERPVPSPTDTTTEPTRRWMVENLGDRLDLPAMAAHARMSVRTFTRRFREETGLSPGSWLTGQRIERARHLLERTELPVDQVARVAGFGTAASLRQHLQTALGVSPQAYRRTFRGSAQDATQES